jgi:small conductance mechanosensitive channel
MFLISSVSVTFKLMLLLGVPGMSGVKTISFVSIFVEITLTLEMELLGNLNHFLTGV